MSTIAQNYVSETRDVKGDNDLPEGWGEARLEDCTSLITKGSTPTSYGFSYKSSGIAFVRVENLSDGAIDKHSISTFIDAEADEALKRSRLMTGDLLFSIAGTIGRIALVRRADLPANTNQALAIIRGTDKIFVPQFLRFALTSSLAQKQAQSEARGGGMNNISLGDVRSFRLPVSPFAEQKRIVAKIEELSAQVNSARTRLAKVSQILKRFRQAVLAAACSGRLTDDWRENHPAQNAKGLFSEILNERQAIEGGVNRRKSESLDLDQVKEGEMPDGWVLVSGAQLFAWSSGKFLPKSKQKHGGYPVYGGNGVSGYHNSYLVEHSTLVIGRVGALCGNVYLTEGKAWVTDNAIYARFVPSKGNLKYLYLVFVQANLNANAGGSGQPFVNQSILDALSIPLPTTEEQHEIVDRVETLFKLADSIEKRVVMATKRADKLTQAILTKAFRGELVPTEAELARREDREYEQASELLTRIKTNREESKEKANGIPKRRNRARRNSKSNS